MLTVICPSRGRPGAAAEVMKTFRATAVDLDSSLWFVVDPDDPTRFEYPSDPNEPFTDTWVLDTKPATPGMLGALNDSLLVPDILTPTTTVVGFVGDDHRFRTDGWDAAIEDYLEIHPGIAYADDLLQREALPTQWFVSREIVDVFGMGLPTLRHLYIDNYWKALGMAAGCLYYLPDIVIEHMHPTAGKSEWDDSYRANNAGAVYAADAGAYDLWRRTDMERDVARLREIVAR